MTSFDDCPFIKAEGRMDFLEPFFLPNVMKAVESIGDWKGCESIHKILEKNWTVFEKRIRDIFMNQNKQPYQVLVHGDFQFKNMISRNGGLKSEDFLLVKLIEMLKNNYA